MANDDKDDRPRRPRPAGPGELAFIVSKAAEVRSRANAPLSAILSTAEILLARVDLPADLRRKVETVHAAALEIRSLFREMDRTDSKTRAYLEKKKGR
jgi:hypothetical protein